MSTSKPPTAQTPKDRNASDVAPETRPRIGLALSSGGAKGLAHIGVIQVLEENGIPIDAVAGASMGAYVGSLFASGLTGQQLEELAAEVKTTRSMLTFLDPVIPPRRGFIRGLRIKRRLKRSLGEKTFGDMVRPLFVIATELEFCGSKIFDSGNVADAVHASIAIPGVFEPVEIDGVDYFDGAMSNPLPINVLRRAGMDRVIAVSVIPTAEELMQCDLIEEPVAPKKPPGLIARHFNYLAPGNVLDIMRRSSMGTQMRLAQMIADQADVSLRPTLCNVSFKDYTKFRVLIDKGRETATAMLPELKRLVSEPVIRRKKD